MSKTKVNLLPVFIDLEMTNLHADYGRLICGCIKPYGQPTWTFRIDETAAGTARVWDDGDLAVILRDALKDNYEIIGYNSVMFDIKFLNSRLMKHGEDVLVLPRRQHRDMLFVAKRAFALSSNRLQSVQEFLRLKNEKTRLEPEMWIRASAGDPEAIDYVVEHCQADVAVLEEVFEYLLPYVMDGGGGF